MAKRPRDSDHAAGEALLAEWGVGAAADAAALSVFACRDGSADRAIAARLAVIADADSVALLQRLEGESADREARKEAKRALYRLAQRGIAIPHRAPQPAQPPLLAPEIEGYLSAVDGRGDQLAWILKPRAGALLHFFAVFNDPEGLREVSVNAVTRKSLREIRSELERRHDLRLVAVDWRYVDFLVHRAYAWTRQRDGRVEGDYLAMRAQITHAAAPAEMENPVWQTIRREEVAAGAALESSAEVFGEPELRTWFPDPTLLAPFLEELDNIRNSPLVLNRPQQEERFENVVSGAIDKVYSATDRDSWRRRLEQMAYFFAVTKRPERARQSAAAAEALGRNLPFAEVPLLASLLRTALAAYFQRNVEAEAEREQSSLIVTPAQVRKRTP